MSRVDALAFGQWEDESSSDDSSSDDETKSYDSDDDLDENPTGPEYLSVIEDQLDSNPPGEDDYPSSALLDPFPQPCDFQLVDASQIKPKHHYLFFDKDHLDIVGFYWFSREEDETYYVYNGAEETPLAKDSVNERLQKNYFFQISGEADFDSDFGIHKPDDLLVDESYILIPHVHLERKKLMVFKGCGHEGACKWIWSWHLSGANISIPKTLMPAIMETSWVYKLIKPPPVDASNPTTSDTSTGFSSPFFNIVL